MANVPPEIIEKMQAPEVLEAVKRLLCSMAKAQVIKERVLPIREAALRKITLTDPDTGERILHSDRAWLSHEDQAFTDYVMECSVQERIAGIKPPEMPDDQDTLLTAEHTVLENQWNLIRITAPIFGVTFERINGSLERDKWLDLIIRAVVNFPGFSYSMKDCQ